jgi:3-dehydroquinate synthase
MQKITVNLSPSPEKHCLICIGDGVIKDLGSLYDFAAYSKVFIITDQTTQPLFLEELRAALPLEVRSIVLPPGEPYKHLESMQKIWQAMHAAGCDRKSLVINLGGGVVSDMGGFAAATYMRGLDFINIPTTLLAQVDASIGGKTGINFDGIKNLIGSIRQPTGIVIDLQTLASLPKREFVAGFGEIIKHGLTADKDYFELVSSKQPLEFTPQELEEIIAGSCRIKLSIVEGDEAESGTRKILNFGHTIGHAIEALIHETEKPLLHGEAISIGMVAESHVSNILGVLSIADLQRLKEALTNAGLPIDIPDLHEQAMLQKMRSDKKNKGGQLNFTLLEEIGKVSYDQTVTEEVVSKALQATQRKHP